MIYRAEKIKIRDSSWTWQLKYNLQIPPPAISFLLTLPRRNITFAHLSITCMHLTSLSLSEREIFGFTAFSVPYSLFQKWTVWEELSEKVVGFPVYRGQSLWSNMYIVRYVFSAQPSLVSPKIRRNKIQPQLPDFPLFMLVLSMVCSNLLSSSTLKLFVDFPEGTSALNIKHV